MQCIRLLALCFSKGCDVCAAGSVCFAGFRIWLISEGYVVVCAAGSMCGVGLSDPSTDFPSDSQSYFVGLLYVLGSGVGDAAASRYAEHQGTFHSIMFEI